MTSTIIEVLVSAQGDVRVQTKGFAGRSCQDSSRFLEEALGTVVLERLTAEFYAPATMPERLQQHGAP